MSPTLTMGTTGAMNMDPTEEIIIMANNDPRLQANEPQGKGLAEQPTRREPAVVGQNSASVYEQSTAPIKVTANHNGEFAAKPVIAVRNLVKTYMMGQNRVPALQGVSLEVYSGEFVAVMGPSGSGKSTFMNMLGCLDRPTQGEYWLSGKLVSRMSNDELADVRNRLIGFVFQGFNLLARASALSNVALPMVYAGLTKEQREARARKVLQLVGLGSRMNHRPAQLSGGQQQRVAVARALVNGPSLLLADEPTGNLDSRTSVEVIAILQALNEQGLTIVLVTHEPDIALYTKRQVVFRDGRVIRDE
jgi:putative ABC transport system ATP-binding protein